MAPTPESSPPSTCPVDPAARAAWLESANTTQTPPPPTRPRQRPLASDRVISSIPRADTSPQTTTPNPSSPNAQTSSPLTSPSGNWIYPSERMFFDALSRKAHAPNAADMSLVVPIHNAVNERAWAEIKAWELGNRRGRDRNAGCGGPRLRSFRGESGRLTPRAWVYGWLGYERPFDRHDWVVERCVTGEEGKGEEVEYVIDFYRGRGGMGSFYLDVRPKLDSWEGWRLRMGRFLGLG